MANAKKTETSKSTDKKPAAKPATKAEQPKPAAEKKPAAKAAAAKKPATARKAAPAATQTGLPQIDTGLAAQSAAKMLLHRAVAGDAPAQGGQAKPESSTFKNLKDQLAKPKAPGLSHLLGPTGDAKKSGGHFNLNQQKGHNQTFGGLNKTGVPRRTNG